MANTNVKEALQEAIVDALAIMKTHAHAKSMGGTEIGYSAAALHELAEAYAWTVSPAQPHGGSAAPASKS